MQRYRTERTPFDIIKYKCHPVKQRLSSQEKLQNQLCQQWPQNYTFTFKKTRPLAAIRIMTLVCQEQGRELGDVIKKEKSQREEVGSTIRRLAHIWDV